MSKFKRLIVIGSILILASIVGLTVFRIFFIKMVRVPTGSMANTIVPGDCLVTRRLFGEVKRGDIIMFAYPNDPSTHYVSRVVGLPGETIHVQGTSIYINEKAIPEQRVFVKYPYDFEFSVLDEISTEGSGPYRVFYFKNGEVLFPTVSPEMKFGVAEPFQVPQNEYFVMSDNRDDSLDSRVKGPVPRNLIWGRPTVIYWSSHPDQSHREQVKWDRIGKAVK
jgi:signal peptidase I